MPLSKKFVRLGERMRDPEWRRYGKLLIAGKMFGFFMVFFLMIGLPHLISVAPKLFCGSVQAADADTKTTDAKTADTKAPDAKAPDAKAGDATTGTATPATPAAGAAAPAPEVKASDIVNPIN